MLELIRRYSSSIFVKAFLGILAATFVFCFGISDIIRRYTGKDYLVKIGNIKISPAIFNLETAKKLNMLRNRSKNIDAKAESVAILHQIIWENIVNLAATDFGFVVSDDTIKKYISGMSMFRDEHGRFNAGMLRGFLYKIQVPEQMFIEFSRKDIKNALIKAPFKYVSVYNELDCYAKANLEKRSLAIVELNPDSINISKKPNQKELKEFYSENQSLFMENETRAFKILELYESDIEKNIRITEEEIKEYYESSPDKESKTYSEIKNEIESELKQEKLQSAINDKVRHIEDALMAGETIENAAKKFNLKIIMINDVNALNKKENSQQEIVKCNYKDDILTVAFSTEEGTDSSFSEAIDEKGNKLLWLVHIDSITPKHIAEFTKISEKVKKEWIKKRQKEKAIEIANAFINQIKNGEKLFTVASKHGYISSITPVFDRNGVLSEISEKKKNKKNSKVNKDEKNQTFASVVSELYKEAFTTQKSEAILKEIGNTVVIAQINEVFSAENIDQKELTKQHASLLREISDDLYQQLVGYLSRGKYEVKINYEMLKESGEGIDPARMDDMF